MSSIVGGLGQGEMVVWMNHECDAPGLFTGDERTAMTATEPRSEYEVVQVGGFVKGYPDNRWVFRHRKTLEVCTPAQADTQGRWCGYTLDDLWAIAEGHR